MYSLGVYNQNKAMTERKNHNLEQPAELEFEQLPKGGQIEASLADGPITIRLGPDGNILRVVDPRRDENLKSNTEALIYDVNNFDIEKGTGFKGLRKGEETVIGRRSPGRFEFPMTISGTHVSFALDADGERVTIKDLDSTNHTFIGRRLLPQTVEVGSIDDTQDIPTELPELAVSSEKLNVTAGGVTRASELHPDYNDDTYFVDTDQLSLGVFDGVGGEKGSDVASGIARDVIRNALASMPDGPVPRSLAGMFIAEGFKKAHSEIIRAAKAQGEDVNISTTASVCKLLIDEAGERYAAIANIGDSRVYLLRDNVLKMLTLDHTMRISDDDDEQMSVQETLSLTMDPVSLEDKRLRLLFNQRNMITAALGSAGSENDVTTMAVKNVSIQKGDKIIITSDGIHDNLVTDQIAGIARADIAPETIADSLVTMAQRMSRLGKEQYKRSKYDDMTAAVMEVTN